MLEILKFIFSSFWIFIGTLCLLPIIGVSIAMPIAAIRGGDINFRLIGGNEKVKENE